LEVPLLHRLGEGNFTIDSDTVGTELEDRIQAWWPTFGQSVVAVIERQRPIVIATWFIGQEGDENTGSLEEFNYRLLFVARDPRKHIAMDSDSRAIAITAERFGEPSPYGVFCHSLRHMNVFQHGSASSLRTKSER
jgi:hypothetical protein